MTVYVDYRVVEKENPLAVHCLTWSHERCCFWIESVGQKFLPDIEFKSQGRRSDTGIWEDIVV